MHNRHILILVLLLTWFTGSKAVECGIPFFRNFTAKEYNANNQNFDILCDDYGTVYIANFEGLLYYDGSSWRKVYTPGISRITKLKKGNDGRIWIGGFNVFGYLTSDVKGNIGIKTILSDLGSNDNLEVDGIEMANGKVYFHTTQDRVFEVSQDEQITEAKTGGESIFSSTANSYLKMPDGVVINYSATDGLRFDFPDRTYTILSEENGLVANSVKALAYDNKNTLWGATDDGLFCAEVATPFSRVTENEGLKGEVYAINQIGENIYIGTQNGLYYLNNGKLHDVKEITLACWQLINDGTDKLIAPTSEGLYIVTAKGVQKVTDQNTMSVCIDSQTHQYITGETEGIFLVDEKGKRTKISSIEKANNISISDNNIIAQNIYGRVWQISKVENKEKGAKEPSVTYQETCIREQADAEAPKVNYNDRFSRRWTTDGDGYNLQLQSSTEADSVYTLWTYPLTLEALNTIYVSDRGNIIAGGDFGIIIADAEALTQIDLRHADSPCIRQVVTVGDSIIWGGYSPEGMAPIYDLKDIELASNLRDITVYYSTPDNSLVSPNKYRYRINGGLWSNWTTANHIDFKNMQYGETTLELQSTNLFGQESEISTIIWNIEYPIYLRWWALLVYLLLLIFAISLFFRWRTKRLQKEKIKLEGVVAQRTSELTDTLDNLKRTQADLVRMERTATAGKLTQGLIDRILNPINYINNFSKLTSGLAKDLHDDIEDEKDNISEDNYEDCEDILGMMTQNLSKIEEHGVNTTRTLRAMEAMLNTHIGTLIAQDIIPLCKNAVKVTQEYHKETIARCGINISTEMPEGPVLLNLDAEAINRILLSMFANSIHAVAKKYDQSPFNGEITLKIEVSDSVKLTMHDNGIGIEDTIKEKVFDPFFTTKPTGEAAGVGLYLVRELVHDHNAEITMSSEQGSYCDFIITFPKL